MSSITANEGIFIYKYGKTWRDQSKDRHKVAALVCTQCGLLNLYVEDVEKLIERLKSDK
jgi:hypothetical protein